MKLLLANIPALIAIAIAAYINLSGGEKWGWFLFVAALFIVTPIGKQDQP